MKIVRKFKEVTVDGIYFPEWNTSLYLDAPRRWDTKVIRRAARKAHRQVARRFISSFLGGPK